LDFPYEIGFLPFRMAVGFDVAAAIPPGKIQGFCAPGKTFPFFCYHKY